jgi:hypothetical protein
MERRAITVVAYEYNNRMEWMFRLEEAIVFERLLDELKRVIGISMRNHTVSLNGALVAMVPDGDVTLHLDYKQTVTILGFSGHILDIDFVNQRFLHVWDVMMEIENRLGIPLGEQNLIHENVKLEGHCLTYVLVPEPVGGKIILHLVRSTPSSDCLVFCTDDKMEH